MTIVDRSRANVPRYRVLSTGWIRHYGDGRPLVLSDDDRVECIPRSGSMWAMSGLPAYAFNGWRHVGWSGDILYWRPVR